MASRTTRPARCRYGMQSAAVAARVNEINRMLVDGGFRALLEMPVRDARNAANPEHSLVLGLTFVQSAFVDATARVLLAEAVYEAGTDYCSGPIERFVIAQVSDIP